MTPRLYATIMLWSASTDPARHRLEKRANEAHAYWLSKLNEPDDNWRGTRIEHLRDSLNWLVNHGDEALIYDADRKVLGIKPECLPDFREWCALYGMDSGGL